MFRTFLVLIFSSFLFGENAFSEGNILTEEEFQTKWELPTIPSKIIPSEHYPSWEESFYENILCQKEDCGIRQRGPRFFILEEQRNITHPF